MFAFIISSIHSWQDCAHRLPKRRELAAGGGGGGVEKEAKWSHVHTRQPECHQEFVCATSLLEA